MTSHRPVHLTMGRRRCLRTILILGGGLLAGVGLPQRGRAAMQKSRVVIVKTQDRDQGIRQAMAAFGLTGFQGAGVAIKANYNSADPFPASTHPETLETLITEIKSAGCGPMVLAERSGMGDTAAVLESMGVNDICRKHGVEVVVMDDLGEDGYVRAAPGQSHWKRGFLLAKPFAEADKVVQTCCLKTHQYGGHFTLSLKNAVGAVAKHDPSDGYNYMSELHRSPRQRSMIAEISQVYRNDLIVMDGMKAFVTGGPHAGREVEPGVIVVGDDPVAVDAVGVAILRMYGTTAEVEEGDIFEQEQIRRGVELGIGVEGSAGIEIIGLGVGSEEFVGKVKGALGVG